jgi:hypothetical protein
MNGAKSLMGILIAIPRFGTFQDPRRARFPVAFGVASATGPRSGNGLCMGSNLSMGLQRQQQRDDGAVGYECERWRVKQATRAACRGGVAGRVHDHLSYVTNSLNKHLLPEYLQIFDMNIKLCQHCLFSECRLEFLYICTKCLNSSRPAGN